ncbi:MAG: glycosyltransferase family 2 protein [Planctomycetota bacterium]|jgi:glycosyltransferase involved in cell wall biosynthesis
MSTPLVSITSAFYNEESNLLNMVKSIFAQTFTDWELILLDDGSTDNSYKIAQSIDDPRVRAFSNRRNSGRAASLNRITTLACGKYIARMDADDICCIERIEKQVKLMESQPDVDIVGTGMCYLDKNDKPLGHRYAPSSHAEICNQPDRTLAISHGSLLGKKSWFEKNLYNESLSLAIDFNLFFRTYKHSTFANVPEPLYYYRLDQSFCLKQQWVARETSARFLFNHYKEAGDWWRAFTNSVVQYSKFAATVLMFSTGLRGKLMARRFELLAKDEKESYMEEIKRIKSTELPLRSVIK